MTSESHAAFIAKVDEFAQSLAPAEQAALAHLLGDHDNDEVAGFVAQPPWPGVTTIVNPRRLRTSLMEAEMGSDEFADIEMGGTNI